MKDEIRIVFLSACLVLVLSFLIFNFQGIGLTGFVVFDESSDIEYTKEMALQAISASEEIIREMQENSFSTSYVDDTLIEARKMLEKVQYAEILRGNIVASGTEIFEARQALNLIDWKSITYVSVLVLTNEIENRKEKAFFLVDKISVEEKEATEGTKHFLEEAKTAFYEDRYGYAESLLEEFRISLEKEKVEASILSSIQRGTKNFFQKNWNYLLIVLVLLIIISYFSYKKLERRLLKNKIKKMKIEKEVLQNLMKKTQEERFKQNIISGLVYNIRMKMYQERLEKIKQELPALMKKYLENSLKFL